MQDRPAYAIFPSRFPFPVFPPLNKPSSGQCVEPTIAHPYLYRDPVILRDSPEQNLDREGGEGVQGDSTWNPFLGREAAMDDGLGKRLG